MRDTKSSFRDNPLLKKSGIQVPYNQEMLDEYKACFNDPIYFSKHYIKIRNVDVEEGIMMFDMWPFQERMLNTFKDNRFSIVKCPRQIGKCVYINTPIRLRNKKTGEIIHTTIGEFYEQQAKLLREK